MSSEQETLKTIPKQFHEKYLNGDPPTVAEALDDVESFESAYDIMLAAIDTGEAYMAGRVQNDANQATAYRIIMGEVRDCLERYFGGEYK